MEIIELVLRIAEQFFKSRPDFTQKIKVQYFELQKSYLEELNRDFRDDNKLDELRDELRTFCAAFLREIGEVDKQ